MIHVSTSSTFRTLVTLNSNASLCLQMLFHLVSVAGVGNCAFGWRLHVARQLLHLCGTHNYPQSEAKTKQFHAWCDPCSTCLCPTGEREPDGGGPQALAGDRQPRLYLPQAHPAGKTSSPQLVLSASAPLTCTCVRHATLPCFCSDAGCRRGPLRHVGREAGRLVHQVPLPPEGLRVSQPIYFNQTETA